MDNKFVDNAISWTFGELEAALAAVHGIDQTKRTAFQSRLKNFHRLHYPVGFSATKGRAAAYSPLQIVDMALAIEMTQLGLPPERASWVLNLNRWATWMAVELAARILGDKPLGFDPNYVLPDDPESIFIYFDPAALQSLTLNLPARVVPDLDEAANSFFFGGGDVVRDSIHKLTSGHVSRVSLINVTAVIHSVARSAFEQGSAKDIAFRQSFFLQLQLEAPAKRDEWGGGGDAEAHQAHGLIERNDITDPRELAERLNIAPQRAADYIQEAADYRARRDQ